MGRSFVHLLAVSLSWSTWLQVECFLHGHRNWRQFRRQLLADPQRARLAFCADPSPFLTLQWRQQEQWVDVCHSDSSGSGPPRYWKLDMRLNYVLLFRGQLPITMTIVILS